MTKKKVIGLSGARSRLNEYKEKKKKLVSSNPTLISDIVFESLPSYPKHYCQASIYFAIELSLREFEALMTRKSYIVGMPIATQVSGTQKTTI